MRIEAMTDDVVVAVRIASFYPLSGDARQEIVKSIADKMTELGHKHNFLVYRASLETKMENNT